MLRVTEENQVEIKSSRFRSEKTFGMYLLDFAEFNLIGKESQKDNIKICQKKYMFDSMVVLNMYMKNETNASCW